MITLIDSAISLIWQRFYLGPVTLESEVEAIIEACDLETMMMDEIFGNFITYELKNNQEKKINDKSKDKNLFLKETEKWWFLAREYLCNNEGSNKCGSLDHLRYPQKMLDKDIKEQLWDKCKTKIIS